MKRQISTILCASAALLAGLSVAAGVLSWETASAATQTAATDEFITPGSYEQYLPLDAPYDLAVSENFTAIADGNKIHVYSNANEGYYTYTHAENTEDTTNNVITKVAFSQNNTLYFLDGTNALYHFHPGVFFNGTADSSNKEEWLTKTPDFTCQNFAISGDDLYFLNGNSGTYNILQTSLETPKKDATAKVTASSDSLLFLQNGNLYYTSSDMLRLSGETPKLWTELTPVTDSIYSMAILGNVVYYTSKNGNAFYAHDLAKDEPVITPLEKENGQRGYSAVTTYAGKIYVVKNESVCEYDPAIQDFTGFEIGASSTSAHRLQEGTDSVLYKDKVYTADKGRVSIYDTIEKTYDVLNNTITANYIATDGETVLLATQTKAALYSLQTGDALLTVENGQHFNGSIVGITQVYGNYYFVTNAMQYWKMSKGADWTYTRADRLNHTPQLLTSDVQGNLYLMTTSGNVYRMSETDFMSSADFATEIYTVANPSSTTKILVDYHQNLYALQGNKLIKHQPNTSAEEIDLSKELAYTQTTATPVTTVAFSAEREDAYVLYNGNLMISTLDLTLPCMEKIATENVYASIFEDEVQSVAVVELTKDTLLVEFELADLQDASVVFPYTGYLQAKEVLPVTESSQAMTSLKIGEAGEYTVIAYFQKSSQEYHTYLVETASLSSQTTYPDYPSTDDYKTGWLSSAVNLYKFPYLTELLTVGPVALPKNQKLTIIGEITVDYDYYHVQYVDGGVIKTGYVPQAFINDFDSTPPETTETLLGNGKADTEAGWRFVFILLGCAAVIILVDFLILRPRKKDE
ncbi:MAG: hypothetical protein IJY11_01805 [Clostridia bacterium]|nr:hypothetical protein [Clostridia bacterium]